MTNLMSLNKPEKEIREQDEVEEVEEVEKVEKVEVRERFSSFFDPRTSFFGSPKR